MQLLTSNSAHVPKLLAVTTLYQRSRRVGRPCFVPAQPGKKSWTTSREEKLVMKRKVPRAALKRIIKGKRGINVSKNVDLAVSNPPTYTSLADQTLTLSGDGATDWDWLIVLPAGPTVHKHVCLVSTPRCGPPPPLASAPGPLFILGFERAWYAKIHHLTSFSTSVGVSMETPSFTMTSFQSAYG